MPNRSITSPVAWTTIVLPVLSLIGCVQTKSVGERFAFLDSPSNSNASSGPVGLSQLEFEPPSVGPPFQEREGANPQGDEGLSEGTPLRLDVLLSKAFANNPALQAARDRYWAALSRYGEAVGLPDPVVQWTHRPEPVETRTGPQTDVITLSQGIPFPGKLALAGEIAIDEARIAREAFLRDTRDLIAELKDAYFELVYLDRAIAIVRKTQDLAQHLATAARTNLADDPEIDPGKVTLTDALKAEAQLAQLSYDLATLLERRVVQEARINRLLGRDPQAVVGTVLSPILQTLRLSRQQLFDLTAQHRQELRMAALRIQQEGRAEDLAELSWVPDFMIGGSYLITGSPLQSTRGAGNDAWGFTVGLTLPLWGGKNESRISRARYRKQAAVREREDLFNRSMEEVTSLFFRLSNAHRLVVLYRDELLPQARSAMETSEAWQAIGRDDFGRVLEAQGVWLNFNLAHARAVADYQQALAALERTVGIPMGEYLSADDDAEGEER